MSAKTPTLPLTSKDSRQNVDNKVSVPSSGVAPKPPGILVKAAASKTTKEQSIDMDPNEQRTELLGSLTTQQHQRTSARVIKKLRLEPQPEKQGKRTEPASDEVADCDTPIKHDEKELKFPTVKQRTPKALWSTDEKNLFFEALNEYGKDFDAITSYIRAKMKKKGMPDINMKTKTQVSHFYYRTWHKLSKHVRFDGNVKKVAQELYALINYGELRKKLVSVNEKTCGRLGEMVLGGSIVVRARGRNLRVRTPVCRALRRLNQITDLSCVGSAGGAGGAGAGALVGLRARCVSAWARVQGAAHNPRLALRLHHRTPLHALLHALDKRWGGDAHKRLDSDKEDHEEGQEKSEEERELEDHLNLEPDRMIMQELKSNKKLALHVGPRPDAEVHLPVVVANEQLSTHNICFSSYLERMGSQRRDDSTHAKIRTPKRQRKDSATEKDKESDSKKMKTEEEKLINIEETAIDGIELMASYKNSQEDERPSTEDEKDVKSEEIEKEDIERDKDMSEKDKDMSEKDKDMSEKEKDSLSEIEDDEKYVKSDTDNESDGKTVRERKFNNLKVKFRIRPKKRGKSIYTMVMEDEKDLKEEKCEKPSFDEELAIRQIKKGWSVHDAGDLTIGDLYLMFGNRSKLELDYWWAEPTPPLPAHLRPKSDTDRDNNKSNKNETEKDGNKTQKTPDKIDVLIEDDKDKARESDTDIFSPKNTFSQDSNDGMSGDEKKNEQQSSPDHKSSATFKLVSKLINRPLPAAQTNTETPGFSQLSDRLRRLLCMAGNPVCGARGRARPTHHVFKHPAPIAPAQHVEASRSLDMSDVPATRRGRARVASGRVVVQRLLPLLPKLPPPSPLIPVKMTPNAPAAPPKILPKPPPSTTSDLSIFYVLSESNGQFYFHDGDRRIPITQTPSDLVDNSEETKEELKDEVETKQEESTSSQIKDESSRISAKSEKEVVEHDIGNFLPSESMSLSPSRLLRDAEGWLEGSVQDFSLSSFLGHLEGRPQPDLHVDSQLHSLLAESSVDYVAKFADLAAEVSGDAEPLPTNELT